MKVFQATVEKSTEEGIFIVDITYDVFRIVEKSGVKNGILTLNSVGSTGSLTTIEYEEGVIADLKRVIEKLVPAGDFYEHEKRWHDGNGHSHVQAALLGPSLSFQIRNQRITLGTWQQIVLINHDTKKRLRKVEVTVIGE